MTETFAQHLERLIAERPRLTMKGLSLQAGLGETAVRDIIKGRSRSQKFSTVKAIAEALKLSVSDLMSGEELAALEPDGAPPSPSWSSGPADAFVFQPIEVPQPGELRTYLPVLGSVRGGDGDEGNFEMNGTIIDRVKAPPALANVRGAYGLYVQGDSMEPRYFSGELVYVHPHKGVTVGCFAVIQFKPRQDGDPVRALVKRIVGKTASKWRVEQYNPPKVFEIDIIDVMQVHRILNGDELI